MRLFKILSILLPVVLSIAQPSLANNTAESELRLLVLGDSLTSGYGLAVEESFPMQLQMALLKAGYEVEVINAGVSGDTTAGGLSRLDWALADEPQLVIVELGGNDALRGLPPEESFANLDAILERLAGAKVHVLLTGMQAPRNLGERYVIAFDQIYPQLAERHDVAFYPFFLDGVALDPALNQTDGIHPNSTGVALIVERILPVVVSLLDSVNE